MGKKAVLKFFIYTFYIVSGIITVLLLALPAWDNQGTSKVGILLTDNNGDLDFGYMTNAKANESSIYKMTVYAVFYLCIIILLDAVMIGFTSLDSSDFTKWLHITLCCCHSTGLVFIFIIYSFRYMIEWVAPLRNYYLTIFGVLIDFILVLLLIMYKKKKYIEEPMSEIKVDNGNEGGELSSNTTIKKNNSKNPQLISEGHAIPLYYNGNEYVEHQPSVKPTVDQSKIVVSDNIVGSNTYVPQNNDNQFQYNTTQPMEVATAYVEPMQDNTVPPLPVVNDAYQSPVPNYNMNNGIGNGVGNGMEMASSSNNNNNNNNNASSSQDKKHRLNSQYTFSESNPYPVVTDAVYNKIPEIPEIPSLTKQN